jgi:hypothetical protein
VTSEVGRDHRERMGVHNGAHLRPAAQHLGVQGQLRRYGVPPDQVAVAVEVDQPDVVGHREGEAPLARAPAAEEHVLVADAHAHVA